MTLKPAILRIACHAFLIVTFLFISVAAEECARDGGSGNATPVFEAAWAAKEAKRFRQMGTRASLESAIFLWKEILRRAPESPEARDATIMIPEIGECLMKFPPPPPPPRLKENPFLHKEEEPDYSSRVNATQARKQDSGNVIISLVL